MPSFCYMHTHFGKFCEKKADQLDLERMLVAKARHLCRTIGPLFPWIDTKNFSAQWLWYNNLSIRNCGNTSHKKVYCLYLSYCISQCCWDEGTFGAIFRIFSIKHHWFSWQSLALYKNNGFMIGDTSHIFTSRVSGRGYKNGAVCVCVCLSVCQLALSGLNRLAYRHEIWYWDWPW